MHESDGFELGSVDVAEGKSEHRLDAVPYIVGFYAPAVGGTKEFKLSNHDQGWATNCAVNSKPFISSGRMTEHILSAGVTFDEELNTYLWDAKKQEWVIE